MNALTQDRNTPSKNASCVALPVKAEAVIYAGSIVCLDSTGHAIPGKTAPDLTYVGRAEEQVSAVGKVNGEVSILVRRGMAFRWDSDGSFGPTTLFKTAYIIDDHTLVWSDGAGTRSAAGTVIQIDPDDSVWIE